MNANTSAGRQAGDYRQSITDSTLNTVYHSGPEYNPILDSNININRLLYARSKSHYLHTCRQQAISYGVTPRKLSLSSAANTDAESAYRYRAI